MRVVLLCIALLVCAPAVAAAQTAPAPTATTGVPPVTSPAPAPVTTATTTATTTSTQVAINVPAQDDSAGSDTSPALVGLLVALALAALVLVAWGLLRLTAWEPTWLPRLRHSVGEAGYRIGGAWAQFRDWFHPRWR